MEITGNYSTISENLGSQRTQWSVKGAYIQHWGENVPLFLFFYDAVRVFGLF